MSNQNTESNLSVILENLREYLRSGQADKDWQEVESELEKSADDLRRAETISEEILQELVNI